MDEEMLREDLRAHVAAGVTMIRSPGLAGDPPAWFGQDPDLPRAVHAGPWIAQYGQFFDGWGRRVDHTDLPAAAAASIFRREIRFEIMLMDEFLRLWARRR